MTSILREPFPVRYRELYLPESINVTGLPSSVNGGHALVLTGAQKGTTTDGVHFTGGATSNIVVAANAIQNNQDAFHITIRFKMDSTFAAGAPSNLYLYTKFGPASEWLYIYLSSGDGKLYWVQGNGAGGNNFSLASTTASWTAGVWYIVTCSLNNVPIQRLLVNGVLEDNDTAAARNTPNGGDMVIGNSTDGGIDGLIGTISYVLIGVGATATISLNTADEEPNLAKGIPPATAKIQYNYLMDEGRGVTATDRGSSGGNGVFDSACTWAYGVCKQPCLSMDGINDYGASSAGVDITGANTLIWAGKLKSTYNTLSGNHYFAIFRIDDNNQIAFRYNITNGRIQYHVIAGGTAVAIELQSYFAIDSYAIFIGTFNPTTDIMAFYSNGSPIVPGTNAGNIVGAATGYIGSNNTPALYDPSKPLCKALIEGAFTKEQALSYSKWLNNKLGMGIKL